MDDPGIDGRALYVRFCSLLCAHSRYSMSHRTQSNVSSIHYYQHIVVSIQSAFLHASF